MLSCFSYDAFVIHAAADEWFVQGYLLGKLGLAPERVLLPSTLEPGRFVLGEIERGVCSSRATIVVLSPAYLADHWAVFGEQIVAYASAARNNDGLLLPLLREDCELPAHIRALVALDFRDAVREAWDGTADRLGRTLELRAAPEQIIACPYPGMRPFTEGDTSRFFGRTTELDELVCRLQRGDRAIYLIGASGSGKSSLIAAGLLPRLGRSVSGLPCFHVHALRPGEQPMSRLADALDGDPADPVAAIDALLARRAPATSFLLVVDQLEELFALAGADQRAAFFAAIRTLRNDSRCVLVFTLRSDFYSALLECPLWCEVDGQISRIELDALRGDSLRAVIERPARDAGVHVQPELVSRLVADAACEPGALPLLQATLFRLWARRRGRLLSLAEYQALGDCSRTGLAFAVSEHACDALTGLSREREVIAFRILLRLVQFGDGRADTRRQQSLAALRSDDEDPADSDAVLQCLVEHRLITVIGDKHGPVRVDLAHEILITAWPLLARWIRAWRTAELHRRELEAAAAAWRSRGSGNGGLLDAGELAAAIAWRDQTATQLGQTSDLAAFLASSQAAHQRTSRQRRQRTWLAFASAVLFATVTATLAVAACHSADEANRERQLVIQRSLQIADGDREHRRSLGALYVTSAQLQLKDQHPMEAARLVLEAGMLGNSRAPSSSLRTLFAQAVKGLPIFGLEHDAEVTSAAFNADGTRVVTASADGTVQIWDASTGTPLVAEFRHPGRVNSVAFSPDGLRIVTGGADRTARIWNARSGQALLPALAHRAAVTSAEFSPDGARVVTASDDGTAKMWDATFGAPLTPPLRHRRAVTSATFSPDGSRIITASKDHTVKLWDATSGKPLGSPLRHEDAVNHAAVSPDGSRIVTASGRSAWIWDIASGKRSPVVMMHAGAVVTASFSRDGRRIVTATDDGTAQIWSATSSQPLSPPFRHRGLVSSAAFNADGTRVVTASADHRACIWDSRPDAPPLPPFTHQHWVQSGVFSPDGTRIVTASFDRTAQIWNAATGAPLSPPLQHQSPVNYAAFSPDGSRVVTASSDNTARIWDAISGAPLSPALQHANGVALARFSPDGSRIVTASWDGTARVWNATTGTLLLTLQHRDDVTSAAFSPDGTRIVTTSADHTAQIWEAVTGMQLGLAAKHHGAVTSAAFSPDGTRVVTTSADHTARIWNAFSGAPLSPPLHHEDTVSCAAFSPDGTRIVTASADRTARIWDALTGQPRARVLHHQDGVWSVTFSADGSRVITASKDHTAQIWDVASGRPIVPPLQHRSDVTNAVFSPDGTRVLTTSWDYTARVWSLPFASGTLRDWAEIVQRAGTETLVSPLATASRQ